MPRHLLEERLTWRRWVTPKPLETKPIHRWYSFPHSFTSELVHELINEWGLRKGDRILDPFAGAGTTLLAAKEKDVPASGYDLSPLAVLATRTKITNYKASRLIKAWKAIARGLDPARWNGASRIYPLLVENALPGKLLGAFDALSRRIDHLPLSEAERNFFRLALLATLPHYSRAVATGGWLKWVDKRTRITSLPSAFSKRVDTMLDDLLDLSLPKRSAWSINQADARNLPDRASTYSAVITSPPYPNRHDYTRVFGVELMFGFLNWEETRRLRYQSFHSHPEARPRRPDTTSYSPPKSLVRILRRIRRVENDRRVPSILEGYFLDIYCCLREVRRVCRPKAKIALVVGNVQYSGEPILVDELTAEVGQQAGLTCQKIMVARYRGNSAQAMGKFGRNPSRESIVLFRRP